MLGCVAGLAVSRAPVELREAVAAGGEIACECRSWRCVARRARSAACSDVCGTCRCTCRMWQSVFVSV